MKKSNKWKCTVSLVDKITNEIILRYGNTYEVEKSNLIKEKIKVKKVNTEKVFELEPIEIITHMKPLIVMRDEKINSIIKK